MIIFSGFLVLASIRSIRHENVRNKNEKGDVTVGGTMDRNNYSLHDSKCLMEQ